MALSPTLWLDKIRAVPSIGIASRGTFDSGGHLLARLKPLLARWSSDHREVKVKIEDHMLVKIERTDGIHVHVSHQNIFCKFFYITDVIDRGGETPPHVEVRSPPVSYSELLDRVSQTVREVSTELYRDGNRAVGRIGIVAEGNVDLSALPPGIERYFCHLSSPWGGMGLELTGDLISTLATSSGYTDKCHHHFTKGLDEAQAMPMRLALAALLRAGDLALSDEAHGEHCRLQQVGVGVFWAVRHGGPQLWRLVSRHLATFNRRVGATSVVHVLWLTRSRSL